MTPKPTPQDRTPDAGKDKKPKPGGIDPLKPRKSPTGVGDSTPTTIDTNLERKVGTANPTSVPGKGTIKG